MANVLRKPWIHQTVAATLESAAETPVLVITQHPVQISKFNTFRRDDEKSASIAAYLSDKFHRIACIFTAKCANDFEGANGGHRLTSIRGAIVFIRECLIKLANDEQGRLRVYFEIGHVHLWGSEGSPVFGEPKAVELHPLVRGVLAHWTCYVNDKKETIVVRQTSKEGNERDTNQNIENQDKAQEGLATQLPVSGYIGPNGQYRNGELESSGTIDYKMRRNMVESSTNNGQNSNMESEIRMRTSEEHLQNSHYNTGRKSVIGEPVVPGTSDSRVQSHHSAHMSPAAQAIEMVTTLGWQDLQPLAYSHCAISSDQEKMLEKPEAWYNPPTFIDDERERTRKRDLSTASIRSDLNSVKSYLNSTVKEKSALDPETSKNSMESPTISQSTALPRTLSADLLKELNTKPPLSTPDKMSVTGFLSSPKIEFDTLGVRRQVVAETRPSSSFATAISSQCISWDPTLPPANSIAPPITSPLQTGIISQQASSISSSTSGDESSSHTVIKGNTINVKEHVDVYHDTNPQQNIDAQRSNQEIGTQISWPPTPKLENLSSYAAQSSTAGAEQNIAQSQSGSMRTPVAYTSPTCQVQLSWERRKTGEPPESSTHIFESPAIVELTNLSLERKEIVSPVESALPQLAVVAPSHSTKTPLSPIASLSVSNLMSSNIEVSSRQSQVTETDRPLLNIECSSKPIGEQIEPSTKRKHPETDGTDFDYQPDNQGATGKGMSLRQVLHLYIASLAFSDAM